MHGKKVHFIIMGFAAFCLNPVPEIFIVDDMIASHQTCQIKGLAGSIQGNSAVSGILIHRLGGDMLMTIQKDIRPDFIRDYNAVICPVNFHGFFQLLPFPHTAAGIVGAA